MKNYTVVYQDKGTGYKAFHVVNATSGKLQKAFDESEIQVIEHIIEQERKVGVNNFLAFTSESQINKFIDDWKLNF